MDLVRSDPEKKLKYPKSMWFIILNELCERFSYYGLKTVLILYLTTILKFNGDESTMIYHSFVFLAYSMPLFGAIMADSFLGKFKTIIWFSMVYALGNVVLTASSMADMLSLNIQKTVAVLGLLFISTGTGGIKPCVFTFGGDQFQLPGQEEELARYSTRFVIAINAGSLVSTFLTPELRHDVHCFGKDSCFPLAFGVPAALMLTALGIFVAGSKMYVKKKPKQKAISRTFGCIFNAMRLNHCTGIPLSSANTHWLDYAKGSYTETEISETKSALHVITVFMAYPVFWALYEQQGSRWVLQATLMNGRIDYLDWTIKPDQLIALIPFMGLIFLFLFDLVLYPLLALVGIREPLQKLTLSGFLAIIAFIFAALLQFKIFGNTTVIPSGEGRINIYNGFNCDVVVSSPSLHTDTISPLEMINITYVPVTREKDVEISLQFNDKCTNVSDNFKLNTTLTFVEGKEVSYHLFSLYQNKVSLNRIGNYDRLIKNKFGDSNLRILIDNNIDYNDNITLKSAIEGSSISYPFSSFQGTNFYAVKTGTYNLLYRSQTLATSIDLIPATFYTLTIQKNGDKTNVKLFSMDEGNYIHILWQLPQYICMIMADVIFIVTSMEFSFTRSPMNLKSFISSIELLMTSLGSLLVIFISAISIKNQAYEYLLYAGIMFADMLLLAYFSVVYRNKNHEESNTQ